jgi:hypothetical protein
VSADGIVKPSYELNENTAIQAGTQFIELLGLDAESATTLLLIELSRCTIKKAA